MNDIGGQLRARWRAFFGAVDATRQSSIEIARHIASDPAPGAPTGPRMPRLEWPVPGRITRRFAMRDGRLHEGIDVAAPRGTAVHPALAGVVLHAGELPSYGKSVVVAHGASFATVYAHLDSVDVTAGDHVERAQSLGTVGSTGRSFGAHLHFELRFEGTPVDPLVLLPDPDDRRPVDIAG